MPRGESAAVEEADGQPIMQSNFSLRAPAHNPAVMARITPPGSGGSRRADQVDLCASPHLSARNLTLAVDRLGRCLFPDLPAAGTG